MPVKKKEESSEGVKIESIKAKDFDSNKYKALDGVSKKFQNKAIKVLEDMNLLEDSEESSIAIAAIADHIKKSEMVAEEAKKKIDSMTEEERAAVEMKKKVQSFNFYEFYMKKMQKK